VKRRAFITLLGGGAAAWPLPARAQRPAMPVIGYLHVGSSAESRDRVAAFQRGLKELGFIEGRDVAIEYRWADNQFDRLPELTADLIRRGVAVIAAPAGADTARVVKALTTTIPIVFSTGVDPVETGLVRSLNQPGGNATGVADLAVGVVGKRLGLLHELLPGAERFALLVTPGIRSGESTIAEVKSAAAAIGRQIDVLSATTNLEIDTAFASLVQKRADALLGGPSNIVQHASCPAHHACRSPRGAHHLLPARAC
jgi:putative tryptophan/tyrosine transport system substrate-binding protein